MSNVKLGFGIQVLMGAASGSADAALTKLAEVTSVTLPNEQVGEVEVTHYESPNRTREYISGLTDAGEITIEGNYIVGSATDQLILDAKSSGDVRPVKIVVPEGASSFAVRFPAIVKGYERSAPLDNRKTFTVTLRIAGAVAQAAVGA